MEQSESVLRIDCDDCVMAGTDACSDCIVTYLCKRDDGGAVVIDVQDVRGASPTQQGGLICPRSAIVEPKGEWNATVRHVRPDGPGSALWGHANVQQLHLVGFTTDHRGLIFSVRRGAKSGGFVVQLDESVMTAVEELRALIAEEEAEHAEAKASSKRPESSLSVREVQARLRRGRTIEQVAREAGVDATWVSRFAVPVLAEQSEIIRAVRATRMTKQRVGLSGAPLGDSVYRNLAERGLADPRAELDKAWRARQLTEGMWVVTIKAHSCAAARRRPFPGVRQASRCAGALADGWHCSWVSVSQRDARGGHRPQRSRRSRRRARRKRQRQPPTTARRSSSRQASKRVAAARRAAAARMVSEAEKATRRNAALARKAAKQPVVLPPREPSAPPRDPLLIDEPLDDPSGWDDELELSWEDAEPDADETDEAEELESGYAEELEPEDDVEIDPEDDIELEDEEPEVEVEALPPRLARRRQPLRARPPAPASSAEQARRRVRIRATTDEGADVPEGNGPVFRSDLAQPVSERASFPRSPVGPTPAPPLSVRLQPIEPPRRRRRLRPLRGR